MTAGYSLYHGDCVAVMNQMPPESIDAIVCDPPYEMNFMGKAHDRTGVAFDPETWRACLRVLKPGGHLISAGGSRTFHRLAVAIEDAGFELRDTICWHFGSGFPKSHNVGKSIDKQAGMEREVTGTRPGGWRFGPNSLMLNAGAERPAISDSAPATDAARQWEGWGTALKPATEFFTLARKPLSARTVAANVLEHGTGALNIDATRIGTDHMVNPSAGNKPGGAALMMSVVGMPEGVPATTATGRWPANAIFDESMAAELDRQSGQTKSTDRPRNNTAEAHNRTVSMGKSSADWTTGGHNDTGGASRFFLVAADDPEYDGPRFMYCAQAPKSERPVVNGVSHSTVKPLKLMRFLVRLVCPPGGTILDPFAGSGTTLQAARLEGFPSIGIESEADYLPLIAKRMAS